MESTIGTRLGFRVLDLDAIVMKLQQEDISIRVTRRSTIWRQSSTGWKILYHQGTIVRDRSPQ